VLKGFFFSANAGGNIDSDAEKEVVSIALKNRNPLPFTDKNSAVLSQDAVSINRIITPPSLPMAIKNDVDI